MFLNESNNGTASSNTTIFNPFESLFGGVVVVAIAAVKEMTLVLVSLTMVHFGNDSSSSFMMPYLKSNETVDILRMLELLQGGGS